MPPKKRVRVNAGGFQHSNHEILGGKGKVFRVPNSGDVYQFQMWLREGSHREVTLVCNRRTNALGVLSGCCRGVSVPYFD